MSVLMRWLAVALLAAVVWAAPSVAQAGDPSPWTSLLPAAPAGSSPDQAAECPRGEQACVAQVEEALRTETTQLRCNHNGVFARAYLAITRDIGAASATPGVFADQAYINHFDAAFAAEYGRQWDAYRGGRATAPAWKIALSSADAKAVTGQGDLFLAVNAHIGRDMPLILYRVGLSPARRADQNAVNAVLYAGMRPMLDELAANYDPDIGRDAPGSGDELSMYQYIAGLRERAWRLAEELTAAPTERDREAVRARIEAEAQLQAETLRATFAAPPGSAAVRDAYCGAHWSAP